MTDAPKPLGLSDFFALEAGEYLERLDALLSRPDAATLGEEFVRLARALRGSALMANHPAIARAAQGLEQLARAVRARQRPWDEGTRQAAVRAVDDLKVLMRRTGQWTDADTARAEALGAELERLAGPAATPAPGAAPRALDAGARAFVAREGAAIASALDRAATTLRQNPLAHDPLQHVLRAIQPLRGLAALADLPPIADLLEGIERAIAELARVTGDPPAATADLFGAAAQAIAQAARGVAEHGKPEPESAEFQRFTALLVQFLDGGPGVVPVTTLYYEDAGPHIVERGAAAGPPTALGQVELVSHGEHLRQAADSLERAPSATQRELRAHTMLASLRALGESGDGPLADALAAFSAAARHAVATGVAGQQPTAFAGQLRQAGDLLTRAQGGGDAPLAAQIGEIARELRGLGGVPPTAPAPTAPTPAALPTVTRAPAPPVAAPAPAAPRAPAVQGRDLSGSWTAYEQLAASGIGPASLDELLAGGGVTTAPSRETAHPAPHAVPPPGPPAGTEPPVVDIRQLVYRRSQALARAQELRAEAKRASGEQLRELVDEVCDLVALALESDD